MIATSGRRAWAIASVLSIVLVSTASASSQPIRVLLVMPTESGRLARQVARLNDALVRSETHIVAAPTLYETDAIVQVIGHRHTIDDKGATADWWEVQVKLLAPVARDARGAHRIPDRLKLLVIGREDWEVEPALDLLAEVLARALGRRDVKGRNAI